MREFNNHFRKNRFRQLNCIGILYLIDIDLSQFHRDWLHMCYGATKLFISFFQLGYLILKRLQVGLLFSLLVNFVYELLIIHL